MKMKKGRKLISILMLLTVMVSVPVTSVHAAGVDRMGQGKVGSVWQTYTGGNSQVYAHLITKADGTEVRYVYSKNYLNVAGSAGSEDSFAALKSVLTADYAALIPDSVDASRNGNEGFFFCSDPSLEEYVNDNWTSAEYVARNFLTVPREGASYTYTCEGDGAGGAINTSETAARQSNSNRFELIKRLAEETNKARWEESGQANKPLDFGNLTGDDIQGKRNLADNQIELASGCNLSTGYEFSGGRLVEVTNISIIERVATIYSEHATISESMSDEISQTVTFKVLNGSWDDNTAADKTVTLTGVEGDTLKLTADQIPAVGTKPNDGYQSGSWDVTPSTETAITGAITYTYTYAQRSSISQTVTFKVVNGSWDDNTAADKSVVLTGYEGDTLKLTVEQIPAVGSKPNDGYQAGSWDVTPSTETAITGATTYTYIYTQRSSISQTVTFKVVNGSWDDNTAADKTVTLTGAQGDTLKLTADQIPAVGSKPNDGYQTGSWDVTPSTETAITSETTYTYTYSTNEEPVTPSVAITTGNFEIGVESARQLEVTVIPQGTAVTYSSSNAAVATVDGTGIVTAVSEGIAVITAKITVDGTDYTGTCTVTVSAIPATVEEIPAHVHVYEWDTINATADQDGEMRYQCRICGDIQTRVPITAYYIFNKETTEKIRRAKQGETVKIETARWISFHKMVMDALADRPDVTLEVSFLDEGHKGTRKSFTIPAGTDTKSLVDDKGFAGFIFLTNKFGN